MQTLILAVIGILGNVAPGSALAASTPSPAKVKVQKFEEIFTEKNCKPSALPALEAARAAMTTHTTTSRMMNAWLNEEASSGHDQPDLNWVRAINPWILPEKFPARTSFTECASHLRNYSDAREKSGAPAADAFAAKSLEDWSSCLRLVYPKGLPPEFSQMQTCLK